MNHIHLINLKTKIENEQKFWKLIKANFFLKDWTETTSETITVKTHYVISVTYVYIV